MSDVQAYLSLNYRSEILGLTYRYRALNLSLDVIKLQLCAHNSVMESVKGLLPFLTELWWFECNMLPRNLATCLSFPCFSN